MCRRMVIHVARAHIECQSRLQGFSLGTKETKRFCISVQSLIFDDIFDQRKGIPSERMDPKTGNDETTVVISTGSSSKSSSTPSDQSPEREERAWKAYFTQEAPLTTSLLTQVNGEDSTMASTLGFLYDYYGVTEDPQGPSSPG